MSGGPATCPAQVHMCREGGGTTVLCVMGHKASPRDSCRRREISSAMLVFLRPASSGKFPGGAMPWDDYTVRGEVF